jgi:ribosomal protein L37AE/L43A
MWFTNLISGIKSVVTVISRFMKLEDRVTILEEKVKALQVPSKDVREGLTYNKTFNVYEDKTTGESFCPTCIGNKKRIAVQIKNNYGAQYWSCGDCKMSGSDGKIPQYPKQEPCNPFDTL